MFWKYKVGLFIACFVSIIGLGQETHLKLEQSVSVQADFIESDNIGNIYLVKGGEIKKYNDKGNFIMKNSALAFGEASSLDASNALKMILFFKDLSQIVYLDNQLSERGDRVSLDIIGYAQSIAVCRSYNEGFWIFDQTTFELTRLSEQLEPTAQSGNLSQILGFVPEPNYMREYNKWIYVNDPEQGILVFDWYGSYTKRIPITGLDKIVLKSNKIFFVKDQELVAYDISNAEFSKIRLEQKEIVDFTLHDDKLLLITKNQLLIYRIVVK
jgi:hypothetical protein